MTTHKNWPYVVDVKDSDDDGYYDTAFKEAFNKARFGGVVKMRAGYYPIKEPICPPQDSEDTMYGANASCSLVGAGTSLTFIVNCSEKENSPAILLQRESFYAENFSIVSGSGAAKNNGIQLEPLPWKTLGKYSSGSDIFFPPNRNNFSNLAIFVTGSAFYFRSCHSVWIYNCSGSVDANHANKSQIEQNISWNDHSAFVFLDISLENAYTNHIVVDKCNNSNYAHQVYVKRDANMKQSIVVANLVLTRNTMTFTNQKTGFHLERVQGGRISDNIFLDSDRGILLNMIDCRGIFIINKKRLGEVIKMRRCNYLHINAKGESIWLDYNEGLTSSCIFIEGNISQIYDFETKNSINSNRSRFAISGNFTSSTFINLPAHEFKMENGITIFKLGTEEFKNIPLCKKGAYIGKSNGQIQWCTENPVVEINSNDASSPRVSPDSCAILPTTVTYKVILNSSKSKYKVTKGEDVVQDFKDIIAYPEWVTTVDGYQPFCINFPPWLKQSEWEVSVTPPKFSTANSFNEIEVVAPEKKQEYNLPRTLPDNYEVVEVKLKPGDNVVAKIKETINNCGAKKNNCVIKMPAGYYTIQESIVLNDIMGFIGESSNATIIINGGSKDTTPAIIVNTKNLFLRNFGVWQGVQKNDGIVVKANDVTLENLLIYVQGSAIQFDECNNCSVNTCRGSPPAYSIEGGHPLNISWNNEEESAFINLKGTVSDIVIQNVLCDNAYNYAVKTYTKSTPKVNNLTVVGCQLENSNPSYKGFVLKNVTNGLIIGNGFEGAHSGIRYVMENCSNFVMQNYIAAPNEGFEASNYVKLTSCNNFTINGFGESIWLNNCNTIFLEGLFTYICDETSENNCISGRFEMNLAHLPQLNGIIMTNGIPYYIGPQEYSSCLEISKKNMHPHCVQGSTIKNLGVMQQRCKQPAIVKAQKNSEEPMFPYVFKNSCSLEGAREDKDESKMISMEYIYILEFVLADNDSSLLNYEVSYIDEKNEKRICAPKRSLHYVPVWVKTTKYNAEAHYPFCVYFPYLDKSPKARPEDQYKSKEGRYKLGDSFTITITPPIFEKI